jgi:hypothetical protein
VSLLVAGILACAAAVIFTGSAETYAGPGGGGQFCGGIAGIPCPEGFVCVDDPRDDCNPKTGGRDCGGICKRAH